MMVYKMDTPTEDVLGAAGILWSSPESIHEFLFFVTILGCSHFWVGINQGVLLLEGICSIFPESEIKF